MRVSPPGDRHVGPHLPTAAPRTTLDNALSPTPHSTENSHATLLHSSPTLCILHKPAGMPVSGNKPLTLQKSPHYPKSLPHIISVPRPFSGPAIASLHPLSIPTLYTFQAIVHASHATPTLSGYHIHHHRTTPSTSGPLSVLIIESPNPGHGLRTALIRAGLTPVGTSAPARATSCASRAVYIACTRLRVASIDVVIPLPGGFDTFLEREARYARERAERALVSYVHGVAVVKFGGLELAYDGVMRPRRSSEIVAETAARVLGAGKGTPGRRRLLDLGTGSGALMIYCAVRMGCAAVGVDNDPLAVRTARANVEKYGLDDVMILHSDFGRLPDVGVFDVVVSNPPYLTDGEMRRDSTFFQDDPVQALVAGRDGLDGYRAIARCVGGVLRKGGALVLEIGRCRDVVVVTRLFLEAGLVSVEVIKDFNGFDRCLVFRNPP